VLLLDETLETTTNPVKEGRKEGAALLATITLNSKLRV
jgi:hypothetical protein